MKSLPYWRVPLFWKYISTIPTKFIFTWKTCETWERRYHLTLRFEYDKNRTVAGSFIRQFRRIEWINKYQFNRMLYAILYLVIIMCPIFYSSLFFVSLHSFHIRWLFRCCAVIVCRADVADLLDLHLIWLVSVFDFEYELNKNERFGMKGPFFFFSCCFAFGSKWVTRAVCVKTYI